MQKVLKAGLLFMFSCAIISCEQKVQSTATKAINTDSIEKADSTREVNVILNEIRTDKFAQLSTIKPEISRDTSGVYVVMKDSMIQLSAAYYHNGACRYWNIDYLTRNLSSRWEGYRNGEMKSTGNQLTGSEIKVGFWSYGNEKGGQDSVVDYNKNYKVSYAQVLSIAQKHGWKETEIQIEYFDANTDGKNPFWQITRSQSTFPVITTYLRVDAITGKEKYSPTGMFRAIFTDGIKNNPVINAAK